MKAVTGILTRLTDMAGRWVLLRELAWWVRVCPGRIRKRVVHAGPARPVSALASFLLALVSGPYVQA